MEFRTRLPRNRPRYSTQLKTEQCDSSSSSDSCSSPPRKRSWKKLHRHKTSLVLGRKNYVQPSQCTGEANKQSSQSTSGSNFSGTLNASAVSADKMCKEKRLPSALLTDRSTIHISSKEKAPSEINLRLSPSPPRAPTERCKGRIDSEITLIHQKRKKYVLNCLNDSKLVYEEPQLKKDEEKHSRNVQSQSQCDSGLSCLKESNGTQLLREVKDAAGSECQLNKKIKDPDSPSIPTPGLVKNGVKRRFVEGIDLVISLRNDSVTNHSTSCPGNNLVIEGDLKNGSRQISDCPPSLFDLPEPNDHDLSEPSVSVACDQLLYVNANDCRLSAVKNVPARKLPSANLKTCISNRKSGENVENGSNDNVGNLLTGDGASTRLDACISKSPPDCTEEVDPPQAAQPGTSEVHQNEDLSLQTLINSFSTEDSQSGTQLGSLNIVNFGPANVEKYCKLSFCKPFQLKCLLHVQSCNLVAEGIALRENFDKFWQMIPDIDDSRLNSVLGLSCQDYILKNQCGDKNCLKKHSIELGLDLEAQDGASLFKMFLKRLDAHSKQLNFRVLMSLLSILHVGFCNESDLLSLLLTFSRFIFRLKKDLQHPLALLILNKMTTLLRVPYHEAAKLILVFSVTHTLETPPVLDLFLALGALKMNGSHIFMLVSSVWHLNSNVVFPSIFMSRVLTECLENMPEHFSMVRDKIVLQMMSLPRREILENFPKVDRFLIKFFPINSKLVFYFRYVQIFGEKADSVERISWTDAYCTSRVKQDTVNPSWQYWDVGENRRNGFLAVVKDRRHEYPSDPLRPTRSEDLALTEVEDDIEADGILSWTTLHTLPETDLAVRDLYVIGGAERFDNFIETLVFLGSFYNKNLLNYTLSSLRNVFEDMDTELPSAIDLVLKALPQPSLHSDGPRLVRKAFISTVNALVVASYQQRKFEYALSLMKAMHSSGVNPLQYKPQNTDHSLFEIICSHIHLECFMVKDAVQILLHSKCLDSASATDNGSPFVEHFPLLEMLVFKLLKHCLAARQSLYALNVFRGVVKAQHSLTFPMNIHRYYEPVLCSTFCTNARASRFLSHEGANLYVFVDQLCGNAAKFHPMTYRSILVALYDADVSEDIIRRTLQCCIRTNAYPMFKNDSISLSCHLATEEMYLYIRQFLQFFSCQRQYKSVASRPLPVRLTSGDEPLNSPYQVIECISVVSKELPDCVVRMKKAFELLSGIDFSELEAEVKSDSEFLFPQATVELLFGIVHN